MPRGSSLGCVACHAMQATGMECTEHHGNTMFDDDNGKPALLPDCAIPAGGGCLDERIGMEK